VTNDYVMCVAHIMNTVCPNKLRTPFRKVRKCRLTLPMGVHSSHDGDASCSGCSGCTGKIIKNGLRVFWKRRKFKLSRSSEIVTDFSEGAWHLKG